MPHPVHVSDQAPFAASEGESLLDAAARAGLARAWRCAGGRCGSCRCWLLHGTVAGPRGQLHSVDAAAPGEQPLLLCQSHARSAVQLAPRGVRQLHDIAPRTLALRVTDRAFLTPAVLRLGLRSADGSALHWLPGQYLELILPDGRRRAFSIASVPAVEQRVELHVRRVPGSPASDWIFSSLQPGATVPAAGPFGSFVPHEASERPLLFVAGGTGVAPIKALIEHFGSLGARRPMQLYWGTRQTEDLYLAPLLERWAAELPALRFVPVVSEADADHRHGLRRGLVLDAVLADHPQPAAFDVYVCGPPAMLDTARTQLAHADLPAAQLFFDRYGYHPEVLAGILDQRAGLRAPAAQASISPDEA